MKRYFIIVSLLILSLYGIFHLSRRFTHAPSDRDTAIATAYHNHLSGIHVTGSGKVLRLLPDDTTGNRHQRFIVRLPSGQTLLIAHNIDVAPRITDLKPGDWIEFSGEYEWNSRGGIVHWTHHPLSGHHIGGWLRHNGHSYQ